MDKQKATEEERTLYLVVYGNYWPREVESVWTSLDAALRRSNALPGDWRVAEMPLDHLIGGDDDRG